MQDLGWPTHMEIYGGEVKSVTSGKVDGPTEEFNLLIRSPHDPEKKFFFQVGQEQFLFVMRKLGWDDPDTAYCTKCCAMKVSRQTQSTSSGSGWTRGCLCPVDKPWLDKQMELPLEQRAFFPTTTNLGPQTPDEWKARLSEGKIKG